MKSFCFTEFSRFPQNFVVQVVIVIVFFQFLKRAAYSHFVRLLWNYSRLTSITFNFTTLHGSLYQLHAPKHASIIPKKLAKTFRDLSQPHNFVNVTIQREYFSKIFQIAFDCRKHASYTTVRVACKKIGNFSQFLIVSASMQPRQPIESECVKVYGSYCYINEEHLRPQIPVKLVTINVMIWQLASLMANSISASVLHT